MLGQRFGRMVRKHAMVIGAMALLFSSLIAPATASAAGGNWWSVADSAVYEVAGDVTSVTEFTLPKGANVSVYNFVFDGTAAPVWAQIGSIDPDLDGMWVPYPVLTRTEPATARDARMWASIKGKTVGQLTKKQLDWFLANGAQYMKPMRAAFDHFWVKSDSNVFDYAGFNEPALDVNDEIIVVVAGTQVTTTQTLDSGWAQLGVPGNKWILMSNLTSSEPIDVRDARLQAAIDAEPVLADYTLEMAIFEFGQKLGCTEGQPCGGGRSRP